MQIDPDSSSDWGKGPTDMAMATDSAANKAITPVSRILIRTDLYAAILLENRLNKHKATVRQSPLWVFIGFLILLFGAGAAHYYYLLHEVQNLRPQAEELTAKADFMQRDLENARPRVLAQQEKVAKRTALLRFAQNRISWAPLLEAVFVTAPPQFELTSIQATTPSQEKSELRISGRTATRNSRLDCDKFRLLLVQALSDAGITADSKFTRLEEMSAAKTAANSVYLITEFTIQLSWKNGTHGR